VTAHLGHDQVEEDDVVFISVEHLERGPPPERLVYLVTVQPDDLGKALQQLRSIIDQQQAWLVGARSRRDAVRNDGICRSGTGAKQSLQPIGARERPKA